MAWVKTAIDALTASVGLKASKNGDGAQDFAVKNLTVVGTAPTWNQNTTGSAAALAYGVGTAHELGRYLDLHGGTGAATDYDARISIGGGTGVAGGETVTITAAAITLPAVSATTGTFSSVVTIGGGTAIAKYLSTTITNSLASIPANSGIDFLVSLAGVVAGDLVMVSPDRSIGGGLTWTAYSSAADVARVAVINATTVALTPAANTIWRIGAIKH